jgi:thymidylate synthase
MGEEKNFFSSGNIPVIKVEGKTLPEVWENSLKKVWDEGVEIRTQYDRKNTSGQFIDPPSRDCTMIMVIHEPFTEPRIHRALPTGLDELEIYRQEVVLGIHDYFVGKGKKGWSYSYHDRLFHYPLGQADVIPMLMFRNQIQAVIENLCKCLYTRRSQAITWDPGIDTYDEEPPCLQRIWCRVLEDPKKGLVLNMNTNWRSRDAYKAAFMNVFALTDLMKFIADSVSQKIGQQVLVGRYTDMSDSYHIYGSYFKQFKGFLETLKKKTWKERTYTSIFAEPFFEEARKKIEKEIEEKEKSEKLFSLTNPV